MNGINYALDLEIPMVDKREQEPTYVPDQHELDRRQRIADEWNAKEKEARETAERRSREIAEQREKKTRENDIEEYMRFYLVSREVASANLEWFRTEGRSKILLVLTDFVVTISDVL
jgi:hypothetical protein